ncbi:MAG TPA: penicillin-binding protein 2, partial [bacterium]|nr:penicillin-binding protein 2 [bacterium]
MEVDRRRLGFFSLLVLLFFGLALYRLAALQLWNGEKYLRFSRMNTLREIPIPAPRGKILDRQGRILADNRPSFTLRLNLAQVKDIQVAERSLAYLLQSDAESLKQKLSPKRGASLLAPVTVAEDLSRDEVARIKARMTRIRAGAETDLDLNGVELVVQFERVYPYRDKAGHVLGYVREVGEKELAEWEKREPGRVNPGDDVGVAGVEKTFDAELRGFDGSRRTLVDALGREADLSEMGMEGLLGEVPARAGETLRLSIDAQLMEVGAAAFGDKVGTLVALDPRNGEVLAWISRPSYDPEALTGTIPAALWKELRDHPDNVLLNRPIQGAYPPGSTYKIVTAIAGLAENETDFHQTVQCPGYYLFGGRKWGCWNKKGHGRVDLRRALISSCDVFFYKLGEKLGPDRLARYAKLLGLGQKTGILSDAEREGLIPTRDWKEKNRKEKWAPSDSLGIAIGQGFDLVTPLQNALMTARFAAGGKAVEPRLLVEPGTPQAQSIPWGISEEEFGKLREALVAVVEEGGGTGAKARIPGIKVGGKTGTAQVVGYESLAKGIAKGKTGDHAWFVAFAPAEKPEIAVAVLVEHGGHGGAVAAPIAQKVMVEYFKGSP